MDMDEEDDFYAPDEPESTTKDAPAPAEASVTDASSGNPAGENVKEDLEEGEEEDEGGEMDEDDESDVDIVTDRKDGTKPAPLSQSRYSEIRNIPQRSIVTDTVVRPAQAPAKKELSGQPPGVASVLSSKINLTTIPIHQPTGKPITQVNIDEDLPDNDKPWRKPGADLSDYFNYGFDEFTWALYAQKQEALRSEFSQDAVAQSNKKMMDDMMMMMGGMMPGAMPGGTASAPSATPGSNPPGSAGGDQMQSMLQQMMGMAGGGGGPMDASAQMDPAALAAMFSGMQNPTGSASPAGQGGQAQNFGGGFGGGQGQGYGGYDQQLAGGAGGGGGGGGNRGNFRGKGRRWQ